VSPVREKRNLADSIRDYVLNLRDSSPYWRVQAAAWGLILVALVGGGVLVAILTLSSVFGGGNITYDAVGSPGPVVFRHYTHMWFQHGKYKECATCHDKLFAAQKYGTFVLQVLKDSPPRKYRIGKEVTTLFTLSSVEAGEGGLLTYESARACGTCATGNCHDGKESFSRFQCLECHQRR